MPTASIMFLCLLLIPMLLVRRVTVIVVIGGVIVIRMVVRAIPYLFIVWVRKLIFILIISSIGVPPYALVFIIRAVLTVVIIVNVLRYFYRRPSRMIRIIVGFANVSSVVTVVVAFTSP